MSLLSRLAVQAARAYGVFAKGGVSANYLVVAGGGGGGATGTGGGAGGGGAGGYLTGTSTLSTLTTYTVTVGAGGNGSPAFPSDANGSSGSNSVLSGTGLTTVTSTGGGGGGGGSTGAASSGGSGGGGSNGRSAGSGNTPSTSPSQGNNGGAGGPVSGNFVGGGGGGANAVGVAGTSTVGGNGGAGTASSISGSSVTYAGGGGGGTYDGGTRGSGGAGGGGQGGLGGTGTTPVATAGTANLGGGGGGGGFSISPTVAGAGAAGGSGIVIISYTSATPLFIGGTITTSGGKQIHTFTSSGTLSPITPITASYLVVAGGGGSARQLGGYAGNGGGGAGGLLSGSTTIYSGATYVVTVGAGGAGGTTSGVAPSGSNSVLSGTGLTTLTSTGGGGGGGSTGPGANGGSGGGGSGEGTKAGGTGTSGQGNNGGNGVNAGGGGGGAGAAGSVAVTTTGGAGGVGVQSSISGTATYYAGGGGGGAYSSGAAGTGGNGGGGNGGAGASNTGNSPGTPNTGGGAGGTAGDPATAVNGQTGGSGIVIISYAGSQAFNGGLVTSSGGNTIHTFTSTGALTPLTNNLNNSLRFRSSASAYLSRTPTIAGSQTTWTWSAWVKRGSLGSQQKIFTAGSSGSLFASFEFIAGDNFQFYAYNGSTNAYLVTTQVFRDPSAWYHITFVSDTTQATAANRIKIYINGTQVTAFSTSTYPSQNFAFPINNSVIHNIGRDNIGATNYFDGYLADINFIDGQALEPYYFGNNDANGVWKPILYKGTYGTNGFYLTFGNTTSTTTLGYDSSPNGNNWTTNNISLTSGTTYDAMTDVPTNTSATVANYPVYDQLTPSKVSGSGVRSISAANLYVTNSGPNGWSAIGTTMVMTSGSGKWYWEVTCSGTTSNGTMIGIHRPFTSTSTFPSEIVGYSGDADGYGYYMGGNKYNNSASGVAYGASYTAGDVIGVALDMSTAGSASITFYKNNTSQGVAFSSLTGDFFAAVSQAQANGLDINFGQRPFSYTPPTGFVALNTFNLPTPTILQGNKYMDATLYTQNGAASNVVVNAGQFKPDLVWIKNRTTAGTWNVLVDSVRGVSSTLATNSTAAQDSYPVFSSFNSNGFTLPLGDSGTNNTAGRTQVAWQWQAGQSSGSSNTAGSITSTVSVNTTAGFSIVTYTGNGTNGATVGHGLGVAPKVIILKSRSIIENWAGYFAVLGNGFTLNLNSTAAASGTSDWNSTTPTSTVFTLGNGSGINQNTTTYVAYCWAAIPGFSAFGSYTGNSSSDGPFVYLGFRPEFVMVKRSSSTGPWEMLDSTRNTFNITQDGLRANAADAEINGIGPFDFLSNGFKLRGTGGVTNDAGTFIYMAFAEHPFKNANAR